MCVCVSQLVDKLNTDSNISDMQMDYSDVSCSVIVMSAFWRYLLLLHS